MKTLLFCTSYIEDVDIWTNRYLKWINAHLVGELINDQLIIIDDGSDRIPTSNKYNIININNDNDYFVKNKTKSELNIFKFKKKLGRLEVLNYPGWYRSFKFAINYAKMNNFEKIIHIESDAFIYSERMRNYVNNLNSGWTVFWCPRWNFPETCIQVICNDQIDTAINFFNINYSEYINKRIEELLPFTNINQSFIGDRYCEFLLEIPINVDYASQIPIYEDLKLKLNKKYVLCFNSNSDNNSINQILFPESIYEIEYISYCSVHGYEINSLKLYSGMQFNLSNLTENDFNFIKNTIVYLNLGGTILIKIESHVDNLINEKLSKYLFQYEIVLAQSIVISSVLNYLILIKYDKNYNKLKIKLDKLVSLLIY